MQEVRVKLNEQVRGVKLKVTLNPAKIVELLHQVQVMVAKIKTTGSISLLESDEEYTKHYNSYYVQNFTTQTVCFNSNKLVNINQS